MKKTVTKSQLLATAKVFDRMAELAKEYNRPERDYIAAKEQADKARKFADQL